MVEKLNTLGASVLERIRSASDFKELEEVRLAVLGKKGALSEALKGIVLLPPVERSHLGSVANQWKDRIQSALDERKAFFQQAVLEERLQKERIDITAPARMIHHGSLHVVTQTARKMLQILGRLGFDVTLGPEVETECLNFEAINIPLHHPARDMQATFFLGPDVVLRTHTSGVQMRSMLAQHWPVRILSPGAVFRCDDDATHTPMFHQIEGLWVDQGVRMSDLKGVLQYWAKELFGSNTKIRFRPSYFPFVEPGAEMDISCFQCRSSQGKVHACKVCKGSGWIEVLGAGMVHPKLFEFAGYFEKQSAASEQVTGFAFGMGIERIAMLLHEIPDLRLLFQGDRRLLEQF